MNPVSLCKWAGGLGGRAPQRWGIATSGHFEKRTFTNVSLLPSKIWYIFKS